MTLEKNIFANYLGAGAVVLMPLVALPWYLEVLGPEQFGLIGFIVLLQALLGLLDAGMSQALVREFSIRLSARSEGRCRAASLLFGFERVYWLFGLCAGVVVLLLADIIVHHWLSLEGLSADLGRIAVYGAAVIFAVQFPGSIYRSLLVGAQAQVTLNGVMLIGALLRHIGGVFVVIYWPALSSYLVWHASIALLETLVRGCCAWKVLNVGRSQVTWDITELRSTWRLVASMSGATWLGALTVQMDKILLSRMVAVEQFGYYTIAAMVSTGVLQLVYPLVQAILPRAIQLRTESVALRKLNVKLATMIGLLAMIGMLVFVIAGDWLLNMWLKDVAVVGEVYPIMAILLVGTAMNAFYNVGYINWIVHEKIRRILQVNTLALVLSVALIPPMIHWYGAIGAALGWLTINLIGFLFSLEWLKWKRNERAH